MKIRALIFAGALLSNLVAICSELVLKLEYSGKGDQKTYYYVDNNNGVRYSMAYYYYGTDIEIAKHFGTTLHLQEVAGVTFFEAPSA